MEDIQLLLKDKSSEKVMSEVEDSVLVDELEVIAQKALKQRSERGVIKEPSKQISEPSEIRHIEIGKDHKATPPAAKASRRKPRRDTRKTNQVDQRLLQKILKEQASRKSDLKTWMEKVMRNQDSQIGKVIADYRKQNAAMRNEIRDLIGGQTKEFKQSCEDLAVTTSQEELERLVNWFHDEFIKELDISSRRFEELRASSETEANRMTEEVENKAQRIELLDQWIKELAGYLPKDVRRELFEELGLKYLDDYEDTLKRAKKERKGFLSRISSLFSRGPPKAAKKHPPPEPKKKVTSEQSSARKRQAVTVDAVAS